MTRMYEKLIELCECIGVSNFEHEVRDYLLEYAKSMNLEVIVDATENVLIFKKGNRSPSRPHMVLTHMDEPGFIVKEITSDGFLHMESIDYNIDTRTVLGKKVLIGKNRVPGTVGLKAIHLTPKPQRGNIPDMDSLSVDIGEFSKEAAEKRVQVGDQAVSGIELQEMGDCLRGRGLNCRAACAVVLELMEQPLECDTWFVFTKKSFISPYFGATLAARRIDPGFSLLINCAKANDMPNIPKSDRTAQLCHGAVVSLKGSGIPYDPALSGHIAAWADENEIPWQLSQAQRARDSGSAITAGASGGKAVSLSVPVRYPDSLCPVVCKSDMESVYKLSIYTLQKAGEIYG